jgi:hypothetical protein
LNDGCVGETIALKAVPPASSDAPKEKHAETAKKKTKKKATESAPPAPLSRLTLESIFDGQDNSGSC